MASGLPAYDANPDALSEVCEILREGGLERSELHEEIEDRSEDSINKNVSYGNKLGFLDSTNNEIKATTRGQKYGYGNLPEDREHQLFKDGIKDYTFYREVLEIVNGEIQEINGVPSLVRDGITRELRINFDFDAGDRVLKSAAGTFLRTLDAAGLGEYKRGSGDFPTRLELNDDFHEFREELGQSTSDETEVDSGTENERTSGEEEVVEAEVGEPESDADRGSATKDSSDDRGINREVELKGTNVDINIDIQISSEDWGKDEVTQFIQELREENDAE